MSIKQTTVHVDKHFCDFCGKMENGNAMIMMNVCPTCGKDVCNWCIQEIDIHEYNLDYDSIYICPDCKKTDLDHLVTKYKQWFVVD